MKEDKVGFYKFTHNIPGYNPCNNDEEIMKLTQKMVLYEDMIAVIKENQNLIEMTQEAYGTIGKDSIDDVVYQMNKSILERAEKLK